MLLYVYMFFLGFFSFFFFFSLKICIFFILIFFLIKCRNFTTTNQKPEQVIRNCQQGTIGERVLSELGQNLSRTQMGDLGVTDVIQKIYVRDIHWTLDSHNSMKIRENPQESQLKKEKNRKTKARKIVEDKWERKKYLPECHSDTIKDVIKIRLHKGPSTKNLRIFQQTLSVKGGEGVKINDQLQNNDTNPYKLPFSMAWC